MDCIVLLLLLSCCGGFGCGGNNRSGNNGCGSTFSQNDGHGRGNTSPLRNANNIRNNDCGCQESVSVARNSNDCDQDGNVRSFSGQNPSSWQDFPEISRRDNDNNCDCEN